MLQPGDPDATSGMTKAIFGHVDAALSPPLQQAIDDAATPDDKAAATKTLEDARGSWRKLSFAVASGVVEDMRDNLDVKGVQTRGTVSGNTAPAPDGHLHAISLSGVTFTQSNDGTGHVG